MSLSKDSKLLLLNHIVVDNLIRVGGRIGQSYLPFEQKHQIYGAIFTCLSTCAAHIELVVDLSTNNFILALHRFISRRGHPKNIFSDNGSNFIGAQRELAKSLKSLDQDRIEAELTALKINWNFSPPVSPWMNGTMEAIVKLSKKHLNAGLPQQKKWIFYDIMRIFIQIL